MRLGHHRLWSPETINEVIGIDDRYVAARGHQSLFVWDHQTGKLVEGIDARSITHGVGPITVDVGDRYHVRTSLDGRWVAAASYGGRVRVYDRGVMKFPEDPEYAYDTVAFSPDGTRIVGTADGAYVFTPGEAVPRRIASCGRNAQLDAAGDLVGGAREGMVGRWSLDGRELARISVRRKVESLSISADGRYGAVTTYGTGGLCMWPLPDVVVADFARGRAVLRFRVAVEGVPLAASLSPDARWLAVTDESGVRLMPMTPLPAWTAPPVVAQWPAPFSIALGEDDRAVVGDESAVQLIAIPSGEVLARTDVPGTWPRWSPDGRFLAELALDGRHVRFRSGRDLTVIGEAGFDHVIDSIEAISTNGKQIAVPDGATIVVAEIK